MKRQHQDFINEYFLHNMNGTAAYQKAYPGASYDTARANAAKLLAITSIKEEVDQRIKEKQMSADEALSRLADMAASSHSDFANVNLRADLENHPKAHLVKTIVTETFEDAKGKIHHKLRLELYDAQAALRDILRIHGKFNDPGSSEQNPIYHKMVVIPPKDE